MHIKSFGIRNFRLLANVQLELEAAATVIVGRNNSGKTSLVELFRRLTVDRAATFKLEDFSSSCYEDLWTAYLAYRAGAEALVVREQLPFIELRIEFQYGADTVDFGPLANLIVDLDPDCRIALAVVRYQLVDGGIGLLFDDIDVEEEEGAAPRERFFKALRPRIPKLYKRVVWAEDPNDAKNKRDLEWTALESIVCADFVTAQRGLDDVTVKESDSLAKIFESLFVSARNSNLSDARKDAAIALTNAVQAVEANLDEEFKKRLKDLVPSMQIIGYPGLDGPDMFTETRLEVERLLSDNTKVRYSGHAGVPLPESYNGLGSRNLILMLLRLVGFYRRFAARGTSPGLQLVFIEEPEVHLHPQMQEVFIRQLDSFARDIVARDDSSRPWPVQFVVSTHSSHIANEAPFTSIRYFMASKACTPPATRTTVVKDLSIGLGGIPTDDIDFLHQYLTLTKCDLFFADKAVLIEGTTERLLLPRIIGKVKAYDSVATGLSSQYITLLEVGGAFAHKFFKLLDFLGLPALVITDLDSVDEGNKACPVERGVSTSNYCLKEWTSNNSISVPELLKMSAAEKTRGNRRLAFQVPEQDEGPCGRSFEDAFILANTDLYLLSPDDGRTIAERAYHEAGRVKKAEFALKLATTAQEWKSPRYILEGLSWLLHTGQASVVDAEPVVTDEAIVGVS